MFQVARISFQYMQKAVTNPATLLFLGACTWCVSAQAQEVRIGVLGRSTLNWPLYVLTQNRFAEKYGLRHKIVEVRNSLDATPALSKGAIHAFFPAPTEVIVRSHQNREPIVITCGIMDKAPYYLVVRREITDVQQLKHRVVGVSGYHSGLEYLLNQKLEMGGLQFPKDYRITTIGGSRRKNLALQAGVISGALVMAEIAYQAEESGLRVLEREKGFPEYQFLVAAFNENWAKGSGKKTAILLTKAILESLEWLADRNHRARAMTILRAGYDISAGHTEQAYKDLVCPGSAFSRNGDISRAKIEKVIKAMVEMGAIKRSYDISELIDDSYRAEALRFR